MDGAANGLRRRTCACRLIVFNRLLESRQVLLIKSFQPLHDMSIIGDRPERADCGDAGQAKCSQSFSLKGRTAIAPTFGLGLNFYPAGFMGFGVEWRALPFSWNTSGFDNHGGGPDQDFPDNKVNDADREFRARAEIGTSHPPEAHHARWDTEDPHT